MINQLLNEVVPFVEKAAPAVARILGLNSLAGGTPWAVYLLSKAFGLNLQEVDKLPQAIADDPDSDKKLHELEESFSDWFLDQTKDIARNVKVSNLEVNFKLSFDTDKDDTLMNKM